MKKNDVFTSIFLELFNTHEVDLEFYNPLSTALVACFHHPDIPLPTFEKAIAILDSLFTCFTSLKCPEMTFKMSHFLHNHITRKSDAKKIVIAVLYGLYYGDVRFISRFGAGPTESFTYLMLQIAAENVSTRQLQHILENLSLSDQIHLIANCFKYYREGSFPILREFEYLFKKKKLSFGTQLIVNLRRSFYDTLKLLDLLKQIPIKTTADLQSIVDTLEQLALQHTHRFSELFNTLVPLMLDFPLRIHNTIEQLKKQAHPHEKALAEKQCAELQALFNMSTPSPFTNEDFLTFTRLFGFKGHVATLECDGVSYPDTPLIDKLKNLLDIFTDVMVLTTQNRYQLMRWISYVSQIYGHLKACKNNREIYKEGFERLAVAMPTKDKILRRQPLLHSLMRSLTTFAHFINIPLKEYPLFVFDQSKPDIFKKNQRHITALNKRHRANIIQVSSSEAFALADKLGIRPMIDTTLTGHMGYAGARNCIFFLTPILKQAFALKECHSIKDVIALSKEQLKLLWDEHVLGGISSQYPAGRSLLMVDDDMELAESNIFCHTLFQKDIWAFYSTSPGINVGRFTKQSVRLQTLEEMLIENKNIFRSTIWDWNPTMAVYSEIVCKPLICLNVPFGTEEYPFCFDYKMNPFLKYSYHLGGTRYPVKHIPTHHFVGLEEYLPSWIPYALHITMIIYLLNKRKKLGFCIFPRNAQGTPQAISSLRELIHVLTQPSEYEAAQINFWSNVKEMLYTPNEKNQIQQNLTYLLNCNPEAIYQQMASQQSLNAQETRSLKAIIKIYEFYKKDAMYLWDYAKSALASFDNDPTLAPKAASAVLEISKKAIENKFSIAMKEYPLTHGFYLLARAVGAGDFNNCLKLFK